MAVLLPSALVTTPKFNSRAKISPAGKSFFSSRTSLRTPSSRRSSFKVSLRFGSIKCQALGESSQSSIDQTVYQGVYGPWTVDPSDVREVIFYRSGLVTAAASFVIAASSAFLPDGTFLRDIIRQDFDLLYAVGAGGLGLSLLLIHIYVTEIKRTLQFLWALGVVGSLATYLWFAQPVGESLTQYVLSNPTSVWFVGPLFAALTGLVFKEGLMDDGVKLSLLGSWMALFVIFAGRKFTQPVKDDIGDKSVFIFNALPEKERKILLEKLEQEKVTENID